MLWPKIFDGSCYEKIALIYMMSFNIHWVKTTTPLYFFLARTLQIVQRTIDKHTDRSEDSAATSEKDASKDSANKKASKSAAKYLTRKRKIGGMGEETQVLVAELSEVEKLTDYQKRRLVIGTRSMGNKVMIVIIVNYSSTCLVEHIAVCSMTRKIPLLKYVSSSALPMLVYSASSFERIIVYFSHKTISIRS